MEQRRNVKSSSFNMNIMPPGENVFNGLHYNIKLGSGLAMVKNAKDERIKKVQQQQVEPSPQQPTTKKQSLSTKESVHTSTSHTTMIVTTVRSTSRSSSTSTPVPTSQQDSTTSIL